MDKEDILKRSRREKDEGLTYAQDRGRQYGVVGFLVLFLVIMIYNMVRGLDNSLPLTLFWAYLSCEAAGRYFARKEKSVLATAVLAGLASLFSLVSYILGNLNLGVEGMMYMGAFGGFYVGLKTGNLLLALLAGMLRLLVLALVPAQ